MYEHKVMKKKKFRMDEEHDKSSDKGKNKDKKDQSLGWMRTKIKR